ncbi:hypothetical protein AGMMS50256_25800 [Betaproteobacteria bacterium]|nr:hypothetical protein AGMMS50256_25800 [Betaproteobacteria bacterium]
MNAQTARRIPPHPRSLSRREREERPGKPANQASITDLLNRIEKSIHALQRHQIDVFSFCGSTLQKKPLVVVAPHPRLYSLFGPAARKSYAQSGALRHEVWEAIDTNNQVIIQWKEIVRCAV